MANTFTQLHIHTVFAVKYRDAVIGKSWKNELHKYITGIVQNKGHKMIAINTMPDHIHILLGYNEALELFPKLMQDIKACSSKWINERKFCRGHFRWQEGYAAFVVEKCNLPVKINYIKNQEEHHRKKGFREEYLGLLKQEEIDFDERYIFSDPIDRPDHDEPEGQDGLDSGELDA